MFEGVAVYAIGWPIIMMNETNPSFVVILFGDCRYMKSCGTWMSWRTPTLSTRLTMATT